MDITIKEESFNAFKAAPADFAVGPYKLVSIGEAPQFIYVEAATDYTRHADEEALLKHARNRRGDHVTDAMALAKATVDKDGFVTIHDVIGLAKFEPKSTIHRETRTLSTDIEHIRKVKLSDLKSRQNHQNKDYYLTYQDPVVKTVFNVVREKDGRLVTGLPNTFNWIY